MDGWMDDRVRGVWVRISTGGGGARAVGERVGGHGWVNTGTLGHRGIGQG